MSDKQAGTILALLRVLSDIYLKKANLMRIYQTDKSGLGEVEPTTSARYSPGKMAANEGEHNCKVYAIYRTHIVDFMDD